MAPELLPESVPLRSGPPTREELVVHYPPKFTWDQLKTFVNSGDLGLLKRDRKLQKRYDSWAEKIKQDYGSVINYLLNHRLQWGRQDSLSLLKSELDDPLPPSDSITELLKMDGALPAVPLDAPPYFTVDTPPSLISIIQNDWPYSIPNECEHTVIWTQLPIFHPAIIPEKVKARVEQDGLWGFTGLTSPPPSPSTLPSHLPALADWGITGDKLIRSPKGTDEEEEMVRAAGKQVHEFVRRRWKEEDWETAWFVNPPRLQSVLGLAHIHVFAKNKRHSIS